MKRHRILIVDDDEYNSSVLQGMLSNLGYDSVLASSGTEALECVDASIDLVLLDIMMPDVDGFEVVRRLRNGMGFQTLPVIMVTALTSREDRLAAVEVGANDFISKPLDLGELKIRVGSALRQKRLQDDLARYSTDLENMVAVQTKALTVAMENLQEQQRVAKQAHLEAIQTLAAAAEFKDKHTAQHIFRMSHYCELIAREYGMSKDEVDLVLHASPMHDIGKIAIPDAILGKPGKLTREEWDEMQRHTTIGAEILENTDSELLQAGRIIALEHHEQWAGTGYPYGLAGEKIHVYGRISAIADVFDALISRRPYKEPFSPEKALEIMKKGRGTHFDPELFDVFDSRFDGILEIKNRFKD